MPTTLPTTEAPRPARPWTALRTWSSRRWWVAVGTGILTMLLVALPTAVIPNPIFGRAIETTWWSYPVVVLTGILGGLLIATYVKEPAPFAQDAESGELADRPLTLGAVGGLVSFFAVGCPVCNKLVLIALGTSGAISWFAPLQPLMAVASIVLMGWALRARLRGEISCALPAAP
ncbi:MAG TPA: hypothetical protein DCQ36_09365 [Actinobacteria bacterium]|jgi:hypothetical protein|nr:hypothetical protein [Actinomycetota bacterium]